MSLNCEDREKFLKIFQSHYVEYEKCSKKTLFIELSVDYRARSFKKHFFDLLRFKVYGLRQHNNFSIFLRSFFISLEICILLFIFKAVIDNYPKFMSINYFSDSGGGLIFVIFVISVILIVFCSFKNSFPIEESKIISGVSAPVYVLILSIFFLLLPLKNSYFDFSDIVKYFSASFGASYFFLRSEYGGKWKYLANMYNDAIVSNGKKSNTLYCGLCQDIIKLKFVNHGSFSNVISYYYMMYLIMEKVCENNNCKSLNYKQFKQAVEGVKKDLNVKETGDSKIYFKNLSDKELSHAIYWIDQYCYQGCFSCSEMKCLKKDL